MSYVLDTINRLDESQWMYHGSTHHDISALKPDRNEFMIDRAIGSHFAADKAVSQRFATQGHSMYGGSSKPTEPGVVYKTKAPPRSQLHVVHQKSYRDKKTGKVFAKQSDQDAVATHVTSTVFSQPEHKQMFKDWVKHARQVDDATAEGIHAHLSQGKVPTKKKFGSIAGSDKNSSFRSYMGNFDSGLNMEPRKGFRQEVVHKYLDIMQKRGIKGLVYQNTSPMETGEHDPSGKPLHKVRSTKSYVIFHPEEHPLEHD
jgi:hypothetical protein